MRKSLPTSTPTSTPVSVLAAALVSATLLTGCDSFNSLYKRDTGTLEPVAAPGSGYAPIAYPDAEGGDPALATGEMAADPNAAPEVLAGEGPDAIQPLDAAAAEPEMLETYTVQKGDTLGHISQKLFGTVGRTKDLMAANPGINPKRMQIGDVINVPR